MVLLWVVEKWDGKLGVWLFREEIQNLGGSQGKHREAMNK